MGGGYEKREQKIRTDYRMISEANHRLGDGSNFKAK